MAKSRYSKEITLILLVKVLVLFILWKLCFSQPIEPTLTAESISKHLLSQPN